MKCVAKIAKKLVFMYKNTKKEVLMRIFSINMHNRTFAFLDF